MIGFLRGFVASGDSEVATLDVGGVGYEVYVPASTLSNLSARGGEVMLFTYQHVRENEISLYGFEDVQQRRIFKALLEVSGVGPKVALAALSSYTPDSLALAISTDDIALLSSIPGVGKKTAQRIALDLKGKIAPELGGDPIGGTPLDTPTLSDAHAALDAMGFTSAEIQGVLREVDMDQETPQVIGEALRRMGGVRA